MQVLEVPVLHEGDILGSEGEERAFMFVIMSGYVVVCESAASQVKNADTLEERRLTAMRANGQQRVITGPSSINQQEEVSVDVTKGQKQQFTPSTVGENVETTTKTVAKHGAGSSIGEAGLRMGLPWERTYIARGETQVCREKQARRHTDNCLRVYARKTLHTWRVETLSLTSTGKMLVFLL